MSIRRWHRKADNDLIDRMAAGWTPRQRSRPVKTKKAPRPEWTYRAYWRNVNRGVQ